MTAQGPDVDYQLHTIGWVSFQDLAVTITSEAFEQSIQVFNKTKDGGRDGAFTARGLKGKRGLVDGSVTIQCKHFSDADARLTLGIVRDEIEKAELLAAKGRADNYVLISNGWISSDQQGAIVDAFSAVPGIKTVHVFDANWITLEIKNSPKLRRLVPRVYGLGDLGPILDQRATAQTKRVLLSIKHELRTMVQTEAYYKSAKALEKHRFCMLTGEPASGKSVIAATHAMASFDTQGMQAFKIQSAPDFLKHWDPDDPRQFFWVDDVFGSNQYQRQYSDEWAKAFRELAAAIYQGAKVIFTSRDYIFGSAMRNIALTEFPLLKDANVIINVQDIKPRERVQILYNHVKYGNQPREYKTAIKPHLLTAAMSEHFVPETARRLGTVLFTGDLDISEHVVLDFVRRRGDYLVETLKKLDRLTQQALFAVFMSGSAIELPISPDDPTLQKSLDVLDLTLNDLREKLAEIDGTLIQTVEDSDSAIWTFKHPTIRDALSEIVASDREKIDIYLLGTPTRVAIQEVRCAAMSITGARVVLPSNRYHMMIERLDELSVYSIVPFLTDRCDGPFLERFLQRRPDFLREASAAYANRPSELSTLLARLFELGLMPENDRQTFVNAVTAFCVGQPSAEFLTNDHLARLLTPEERDSLLSRIKYEVIPNLERVVESWESSFSSGDDPDQHYDRLIDTMNAFRDEFIPDLEAVELIDDALQNIDGSIDYLKEAYPGDDSDDDDYYEPNEQPSVEELDFDRDPFEDVDA